MGEKLELVTDFGKLKAGDLVVAMACGWGAHQLPARHPVLPLGAAVKCLGKTKDGAPRHPLYLRSDTPLEDWP